MNGVRYQDCINACMACATACQYCATECLKENNVKLLSLCIALTRECALVCTASAQLMAIGGDNALLLCEACATMCDACAKECLSNGELNHCRYCAEMCSDCAEECRKMVMIQI
jgi:hypothetical protein